MNFDNDDFDDDEFSEEEFRKKKEANKNHPLTNQAKEILKIVNLLLECIGDESEREIYGSGLMKSALLINAKLAGAVGSESYLACMQNASIIRYHAEYIRLSNHRLSEIDELDKGYILVLRSEMEKFRELFVAWMKEIKRMKGRDDLPDEWGLF